MIPTSITSQANCQRKSHRLTIPIQVIIRNESYMLNNWSANGFQIEDLKLNIQMDETVDATLILPTGGASISLNIKAKLKNKNNNLNGFEIVEITDKNSRVLRHYASLAIDGNYNHIDDLSSDLFMTDVATPIKEPITLTEKEEKQVHKSFLKRVGFYTILGLLFLILIFLTILYNYLIVEQATGLISGNAHNYNSPKDGLLSSIYVKNNQNVTKGELLFEMDSKNEKALLQNKEEQAELLKKQLQTAHKMIASIDQTIKQKREELYNINESAKSEIKVAKKEALTNYKRAKYLYHRHLITSQQFSEIQSQYLQFLSQYNAIVLYKNTPTKENLLISQTYTKSQDQKISLQKSIDALNLNLTVIKDEIATLKKGIHADMIVAQEDGTVHNIFQKRYSYLKFSDNVLSLETKQKPYILTKLVSDEIGNIHLGEPCLIYSTRLNKFFNGHIVGMGYSVTNGTTTNTVEISQNEIPIKVAFDNQNVDFHLNEYLKIYFLNSSEVSKTILHLLPQNLVLL
jgi:multidrug resistance efflux pump